MSACYDDVWYALVMPPQHQSAFPVTAQGIKTGIVVSREDILMATLKVEMVLYCIRKRFKQVLNLILDVYFYRQC